MDARNHPRIDLFDGECYLKAISTSPYFYYWQWIEDEKKHFKQSTKTASPAKAMEIAKSIYKKNLNATMNGGKVLAHPLSACSKEYAEELDKLVLRGEMCDEYAKANVSLITNQFIPFVGINKDIHDLTAEIIQAFMDAKAKEGVSKSALKGYRSKLKNFWEHYLLPRKYVTHMPHIRTIKIKKRDRAKREDTFLDTEYRRLARFLREWVKEKNVSEERIAVGHYARKDGQPKKLTAWHRKMELHRRILMREFILICANTGLRCPSEPLILKRKDVRVMAEEHEVFGRRENVLVAYLSVPDETKTGERVVIGHAGKYVKRLIDYYRTEFGHELKSNDPLFLEMYGARKGKALSADVAGRMWRELQADCGFLDRIKFDKYMFRSFYVTNAYLNDIPAKDIAANLGNSETVLEEHYKFIKAELNSAKLLKRESRSNSGSKGSRVL